MIERHLPVLVPVTLLLFALIVPLVGLWRRGLAYHVTLGGMVLSLLWSVLGLSEILSRGSISYHLGGWQPPIGIELVLDALSAFMILLIVSVAFLVLLHSRFSLEAELPGKEVPFFSVSLLFLTGLTGIVLTGDLFNLYVFLEISSLAGYALVAIGDKQAPVASFRYLLLGTVGATFYLLGLGFVFTMTGSLNMADVAKLLPALYSEPSIIVGFLLMISGIALKMGLFPLHAWLPDAYTYASSASSALIAPVGTKVAAYVLIRLLFFVFEPSYGQEALPVADVLCWLAAGGILFGSIMAMAQQEMKRMLAYSSVAQVGYIALGLGLGTAYGLIGAVLHMLNHAVMKATLFLVSGNLRYKLGHSMIPDLNDTLRKRMPWSMAAFTVAALSMIGIPPLAGFFSKWYLVLAGIERSAWIFVGVILVSSLLNAIYFFRVLEKAYLRTPTAGRSSDENSFATEAEEHAIPQDEVAPSMLVPTLVLSVSLLVLGLMNTVIVNDVLRLFLPAGL